MIIDSILDRKAGFTYNEEEELQYMYDMATLHSMDYLAAALDGGSDLDIKKALAKYVIENNYNIDIIDYIYSVKWLDKLA